LEYRIPPNKISGLTLWLQASSIAQSNGTTVSSWPDSSTAGIMQFNQLALINLHLKPMSLMGNQRYYLMERMIGWLRHH